MSFEVEVKYRSVDHERLRRLLAERGAREVRVEEQEDIYLRHPARDFAQTNEALRLRRVGGENRITYKGPRLPGPTKTREEIELPFRDGAATFQQLARLFERLGFQPVAAVRKRRQIFELDGPSHQIEFTLDRVEGLGDFAEIEAIVPDESGLPSAQSAVLALAAEFGLEQVELRSYLGLILQSRPDSSGR